MHIGAIGWWNYDNQGDLAMLAALRQGLAPHRIVPIDIGFPANEDTIYRLNRLDYVILGGGTLIPGIPDVPFDTFNHWADRLECPLGVIGLGVDPIVEQYWPSVCALLDRAQFFFVRDQAAHRLLRSDPRVRIMPDLTFAYPLSAREDGCYRPKTTPVCGVNLRRAPGLDPVPWLQTLAQLPVRMRGVPLSSFQAWTESSLLRQLDPNSPERFDPALYREIDLMIGTAFHSVLFSVQAAVPVIAIDYSPKVRNFMADVGLEDLVLSPDEPHRLPELVKTTLEQRSAIVSDLQVIRESLRKDANRSIAEALRRIESSGQRHARYGPKVSVVVVESGNQERDRRTLDSCVTQTYGNVEVLVAKRNASSAGPADSTSADRSDQPSTEVAFEEALLRSGGEYLTWMDGGDWMAQDMLECLVAYLDEQRQSQVVYADYYFVSDQDLPLGHHSVPMPQMLYRRDVVGPCFLVRREFLGAKHRFASDPSLVGYGFWLQAGESTLLTPFHAPIFYSARLIRSSSFVAQEREVRRVWRRCWPTWSRAFWQLADSDFSERFVVQPIARVLKAVSRSCRARGV